MRIAGTKALAVVVALAEMAAPGVAGAQGRQPGPRDKVDRSALATVVHLANVFVAADGESQKASQVEPGHEVTVMERNGQWVRVFANTDVNDDEDRPDKPEFEDPAAKPAPAAGWMRDKGMVGPTTREGDMILYGAAANLEEQAEEPHAPKNAALEAGLLYRRVYEYFPDSTLAPEAAWRSADIQWRLEKRDVSTLPSAKEQESYLRPQIYEGDMRKLMKLYPGSKQAALAAYELIDNKLCGDWQGLPKCPEEEAKLYERYASQYPDGPKAAEALYNATYREGVLVTMYTVQDDRKREEAAAKQAQDLAAELKQDYPKTDYAARAASIAFKVAQGIPVYGNDLD